MSFIILALVVLVFVIIYQVAKASEYATALRSEEKVKAQTNRTMAWLMVAMFVLGMWGIWECHRILMPHMLPQSASDHGVNYDNMLKVTLIVTGIVFFLTQGLLFWFSWRYQAKEKTTSFYFPHNNKLELIWTTIPALTMAILVAIGLKHWFKMTSEAPANAQIVEVVGKQFNWVIRYPGKDKALGKRDFRLINDASNVLGQDWNDKANRDDIINETGELHLVKGRPVKLVIGSRDVIHDVGLPHFRMKMDAVPGITTTMWFTPIVSTKEMKAITGNENFVYEIACDQMCGQGHYSMRGTVVVHDNQAQLDAWLLMQTPYYTQNQGKKPETPAAGSGAAQPEAAGQNADSTKTLSMR